MKIRVEAAVVCVCGSGSRPQDLTAVRKGRASGASPRGSGPCAVTNTQSHSFSHTLSEDPAAQHRHTDRSPDERCVSDASYIMGINQM